MELLLTSRFQRVTTVWLSCFSLLCVVLAALAPLWGKGAVQFVIALPFIHGFLFVGVLSLCSLPSSLSSGPSDRYIREHHPALWQKLHPWGRLSYNSFTALGFMLGSYDDGSDERLQQIKHRYRYLVLLQLWLFALLIVPFPILYMSMLVIDFVAPQISVF